MIPFITVPTMMEKRLIYLPVNKVVRDCIGDNSGNVSISNRRNVSIKR